MKRLSKFDENIITEYHKSCPTCGKVIYYRRKLALYCAVKQNSRCKLCRIESMRKKISGRHWKWKSDESRIRAAVSHKNSEAWKTSMNTSEYKARQRETKLGEKNSRFGIPHTQPTRDRIGEKTKARMAEPSVIATLKNQKWTPEQREKHRIAVNNPNRLEKLRRYRLDQIKKSGGTPAYNKSACNFFDTLNQKLGWDGQHALHRGEKGLLGYSVDYYEPAYNLVIEWDEEYHYRGTNIREKDAKRQRILIDSGVKMYRIREKTGEIHKCDVSSFDFINELTDILNEIQLTKA